MSTNSPSPLSGAQHSALLGTATDENSALPPETPIDRELRYLRERAGAPRRPNLGCSTIAHDRLGFCGFCVPALRDGGLNGSRLEAACWQLLALREASS